MISAAAKRHNSVYQGKYAWSTCSFSKASYSKELGRYNFCHYLRTKGSVWWDWCDLADLSGFSQVLVHCSPSPLYCKRVQCYHSPAACRPQLHRYHRLSHIVLIPGGMLLKCWQRSDQGGKEWRSCFWRSSADFVKCIHANSSTSLSWSSFFPFRIYLFIWDPNQNESYGYYDYNDDVTVCIYDQTQLPANHDDVHWNLKAYYHAGVHYFPTAAHTRFFAFCLVCLFLRWFFLWEIIILLIYWYKMHNSATWVLSLVRKIALMLI